MLHRAGQPGIKATRRLISAHFVWPLLAKQVMMWAQNCVPCQRAKTHKHFHLALAQILMPSRHFGHVRVDLVSPLLPSRGCTLPLHHRGPLYLLARGYSSLFNHHSGLRYGPILRLGGPLWRAMYAHF